MEIIIDQCLLEAYTNENRLNELKDYYIDFYVRKRYSLSEELAILRQRDTKPLEFSEYNSYVELVKEKVKEVI